MPHRLDVTNRNFDVLVIGGGPAGSTVSTLLAAKGWNVALLEKDTHPRFHIGESLLPCNMPLLDRLGVMNELRQIGVVKPGIDFTMPDDNRAVSFKFAEALDHVPPTAFQVRRSEFDHMLIQNAARKGVHIDEGVRVADVDLNTEGRVSVRTAGDGGFARSYSARFLIDASGRDTLLGRKLGIKERNPKHASAALFAHFRGVERRSGEDEGNISIYWFEHGWIWMIPLRGDVMSIGVVSDPTYLQSRTTAPEAFLLASLELSTPAAARSRHAEMITPATATGNYSYLCRSNWGPNYVMVGDAFAFIDPVFSSGVYFAMKSSAIAADAVDTWLRDQKKGLSELRKQEILVRRGIRNLSWFIHRFNRPGLKYLFMHPKDRLGVKAAVLSILAGDVYGNKTLFLPLLLFKALYLAASLLSRPPSAAHGE
jgi:flavin-dependent dehydrogenase